MNNPVRTWMRRHLSVIGLGVAISVGGLIEPKARLGMELHFTDFAQLLRGIRPEYPSQSLASSAI